MILDILKIPEYEPALRAVCKPAKFSEALSSLAENMIETMFSANGIGLAAPQVGHDLRMFVMMTRDGICNRTYETMVLVNPILERRSEFFKTSDTEGCLSIPGVEASVTRCNCVRVTYFNLAGAKKTIILEGLAARVLQHEFDHLDGILFTDYVVDK